MMKNTPTPGNDLGLPDGITRRSLLHASPAILAPCLLAGPALASTDTPLMRLYRDHEAVRAAFNVAADGPEADGIYARMLEIEHRIAAEPATSAADVAVKVLVLTQIEYDEDTIYHPGLLSELQGIVAGALS